MFRGSQVRTKAPAAKQAEASSVKIQSLVRKHQQQKKFQKEKDAVETIKRFYRENVERKRAQVEQKELEKQTHEANKPIENETRRKKRNQRRREALNIKNKHKREAVVDIQRMFRGSQVRAKARAAKQFLNSY